MLHDIGILFGIVGLNVTVIYLIYKMLQDTTNYSQLSAAIRSMTLLMLCTGFSALMISHTNYMDGVIELSPTACGQQEVQP